MSSNSKTLKTPAQSGDSHGSKAEADPSLPHERDQGQGKSEMQGVAPGSRNIIKQAHDDIESGQQDTDMHDQRTLENTSDK